MSRNGSGTYSLPAGNPVVTGTTISSTWANNTMNDIASALTDSVAADGQTPMTGNLDLNSNKIVNLADPTLVQDAATKNYVDTADALALLKANNLSDVASASTSRTNLGLGSIATQNSNNVSITGGSISGISLSANDISSGTLGKARLPTGSVLQVIQTTTQTPFSTSSGSAVSTGFSATITPTASSSKILVIAYSTLGVPATGMNGHIDLRRGTLTTLVTDWYMTYGAASYLNAAFTAVYLDSPATTSSTTYNLYAYRDGAAGTFYVGAREDGNGQILTSVTLMEIAA